MFLLRSIYLLVAICLVAGQRPSFAGSRPIGFPELQNKTSANELADRFGDDGEPLPLPIEARGDVELVKRISKLPIDKQPFWYLNWKALEENRRNPQTFEQRPSPFNPSTNNAPNTNVNNPPNNQLNNQPNNQPNNQSNDLISKFGTDMDNQSKVEAQVQTNSYNQYKHRSHRRYY